MNKNFKKVISLLLAFCTAVTAMFPVNTMIAHAAETRIMQPNEGNESVFKQVSRGVSISSVATRTIDSYPEAFDGLYFLQMPNKQYSADVDVTMNRSGWIYVIISSKNKSHSATLEGLGYTLVDIPSWSLYEIKGTEGTAVYEKQVTQGETLTLTGEGYAVPIESETQLDLTGNCYTKSDSEMAVMYPLNGEGVLTATPSGQIFSDDTIGFNRSCPYLIAGKNFIMGKKTGGTHSAKAVSAGYVYALTEETADSSQITNLKEQGFTEITIPDYKLFYLSSDTPKAPADLTLLEKYVEKDEVVTWNSWAILFFSGDDDYYYYPAPSYDIAANIVPFPDDPEYAPENRLWQGCPTIGRTAGGRLWAGWMTGDTQEPRPGNYVPIAISDDNGQTWEAKYMLLHPTDGTTTYAAQFWLDPDGRFWLFWSQREYPAHPIYPMYASYCDNPDADEPVWSTPRRVGTGNFSNAPTALSNGEWVLPTWDDTTFDLRILSSVDKGETWTEKGKVTTEYTSCPESVIVEKKDKDEGDETGTLWINFRTSSESGGVYEAFSFDGGRTWTDAQPSTSFSGPSSRFTIDRMPSGNLVLINHYSFQSEGSDVSNEKGEEFSGRDNLTAMISTDDGATWEETKLQLFGNICSYPYTAISKEGVIYVVYDSNRYGDALILMSSFTEEDIRAGEFQSEDAQHNLLVSRAGEVTIPEDAVKLYDFEDMTSEEAANAIEVPQDGLEFNKAATVTATLYESTDPYDVRIGDGNTSLKISSDQRNENKWPLVTTKLKLDGSQLEGTSSLMFRYMMDLETIGMYIELVTADGSHWTTAIGSTGSAKVWKAASFQNFGTNAGSRLCYPGPKSSWMRVPLLADKLTKVEGLGDENAVFSPENVTGLILGGQQLGGEGSSLYIDAVYAIKGMDNDYTTSVNVLYDFESMSAQEAADLLTVPHAESGGGTDAVVTSSIYNAVGDNDSNIGSGSKALKVSANKSSEWPPVGFMLPLDGSKLDDAKAILLHYAADKDTHGMFMELVTVDGSYWTVALNTKDGDEPGSAQVWKGKYFEEFTCNDGRLCYPGPKTSWLKIPLSADNLVKVRGPEDAVFSPEDVVGLVLAGQAFGGADSSFYLDEIYAVTEDEDTINFAKNFYITTVAGANGTITPSAFVSEGTEMEIVITPDSGYHIGSLKIDGIAQPITQSITLTVGKNQTVSVEFVKEGQRTIKVYSISVDGVASIAPVSGGGVYEKESTVELSAERKEGYTFKGWYIATVNENDECIGYDANSKVSSNLSWFLTVDSDENYVAVYEANGKIMLYVNGSNIQINGRLQSSSSTTVSYRAGTSVALKYVGTGTFCYWKNDDGKILSKSAEYTFNLISETGITAVVLEGNETAGTMSFVEFVTDYEQILLANTWYSDDEASDYELPVGPSKLGHRFLGWSLDGSTTTTAQGILDAVSTSTHLVIKPLYEAIISEKTVKVSNNVNSTVDSYTVNQGERLTITSEDIDGYTFACWKDENENVLSYAKEYTLQVSNDINIVAYYVTEGTAIEKLPVVAITGVSTSTTEDVKKISFTATRSISEAYEVVAVGMIYDKHGKVTVNTMDSEMVLDGKNVVVKTSSSKKLNGALTLNILVDDINVPVYARGYITVKNIETGNVETYYSQVVYSLYSDFHSEEMEGE